MAEPLDEDALASLVTDVVFYGANRFTARRVTARKAHACSMAADGSWFRACHTVSPGERYVRVTIFTPGRQAPLTAALCAACALDAPMPEEVRRG